MSLIDLGMDFDQAEKESGFEPLPDGVYEFQIASVDQKTTSAGRPMLAFQLEVINQPEYKGRRLFYNCPLPYVDSTGKRVTDGLGFLTALFKNVGARWEGTSFDPNTLLGRTGVCTVTQRTYEDRITNDVKIK